ncbi:MAG: hypothetical protein ACRDJE_09725 [Dehalococcoidia bacterium]
MKVVAHGTVQGNEIVFPEGLGLPDGTRVVVSIEPEEPDGESPTAECAEEIATWPFFGMWADREDMADSVAWVRRIREQWRQRPTRRA